MEYCPDCARHQRSFDEGVSLLNYNSAARRSMAAIKYKNRREYLDFYAEAIWHRYGKWLEYRRADALVPVPVHPSRLRQRGFNQAEELAKRLSRRLGIPVANDLIIRLRKTAPQKELTPQERLKNLRQAFAVSGRYSKAAVLGGAEYKGSRGKNAVIPRSVILVDDIYTTGSTVEACTRVLKEAGVKHVYCVTICIGNAR